jgi:hypothetical protein
MRKPHKAGEENVLLAFRQCAAAAFRERCHAAIPELLCAGMASGVGPYG